MSAEADRLGFLAEQVSSQTMLAMLEGNWALVEAGAKLLGILVDQAEAALAREDPVRLSPEEREQRIAAIIDRLGRSRGDDLE